MTLYFCFVETKYSRGSVGTVDLRLADQRGLPLAWAVPVLMAQVLRDSG